MWTSWYNSLFFYMLTALPGVNCSKLFNMVVSICLAINMADPFRRLNTIRVKRIVICICSIIVLLHILDTAIVTYAHLKIYTDKSQYQYTRLYLWTMVLFDPPGLISILMFLCSIVDGSGAEELVRKTHADLRIAILITYLTRHKYEARNRDDRNFGGPKIWRNLAKTVTFRTSQKIKEFSSV